MIQFANPAFFWLLGAVPLLIAWYIWKNMQLQAALLIPSIIQFTGIKQSFRGWARHSLFVLRILAYIAIVVALARPQVTLSRNTISSEGIDVMIAFDVSGSMLAKDFVPSRLDAAKKVAEDFIDGRPNDRIGIVFFAAEAYTGCPITIDHTALKQIIADVQPGAMEDGTAIGLGLGTAVSRLSESTTKTRIIILVTDGENNAGAVKPLEAAQYARSLNIRTYCIGILPPGAEEKQSIVQDSMYAALGGPTAETTLLQIAEITGSKYFRATNEKKLAGIYKEIDQLEKTTVDVASYTRYEDRFFMLAFLAAMLVFSEMILRYTILKTAP
jgi:Ca-activated chloride channel family protein